MALCPHLAHMHTQTYKHTHATFGSGRRGILFNGIMLFFFFFSLLSPFPQTPCLPCQENNESTKPFVRTSTQHFHLRPPTHPQKKQPTLHSHLPNVISTLSHFHPPTTPCPHACLPAPLLAARPRRQAFFLVISSARSRCARDYCKMKVGEGGVGVGGGGGGGGEAVRGRRGGAERETESRGPSLSAGVKMVTSAGRRVGDRCADCTYCLECVSSEPKPGEAHYVITPFFFFFLHDSRLKPCTLFPRALPYPFPLPGSPWIVFFPTVPNMDTVIKTWLISCAAVTNLNLLPCTHARHTPC